PSRNVIDHGISRHDAEQIASESSGSDNQKAEVVEFLCHPEAATAICSAFYQSFNVPALTLTHERISKASEYNAERSLDTPNACINISISQSSDGNIYVTSHTGVLIMAPEDRPNEMGMLTNRTSYEVPQGVKCTIDEMVRALQPRYAASETYLQNT
ncbi:type III secretion system LEE effector EspG, partial [Escherichia coli]|nr:type III secretion system LEE effector EspG [Escherichia coli]